VFRERLTVRSGTKPVARCVQFARQAGGQVGREIGCVTIVTARGNPAGAEECLYVC